MTPDRRIDPTELWQLTVTRNDEGLYVATLMGQGRGIRIRAADPDQALSDLHAALGQADLVGIALRSYVVGGEDLLRHAVAAAKGAAAPGSDVGPEG